jgi:hypothetical protein
LIKNSTHFVVFSFPSNFILSIYLCKLKKKVIKVKLFLFLIFLKNKTIKQNKTKLNRRKDIEKFSHIKNGIYYRSIQKDYELLIVKYKKRIKKKIKEHTD